MSDTRDGQADQLRELHEAHELHAAGDPVIEAHYRAASTEVPSAAADAAILAQARTTAHAAGGAANDASWHRRLRAPLALAACAVLAVGIVTRIGVETPEALRGETPVAANPERPALAAPAAPGEAATAQLRSPASPPANAPTTAPNSALATTPNSAPAVEAAKSREHAQKAAAAEAAAANLLAGQPAPTPDALPPQERKLREEARADSAAQGMRERPALAKAAAPAPAAATAPTPATAFPAAPYASVPAPAAKPAARTLQGGVTRDAAAGAGSSAEVIPGAGTRAGNQAGPAATQGAVSGAMQRNSEPVLRLSAAQEAELPAERWLAYVIELRRSGQHAAADASLVRFRARYPDQVIPPGARGPQPVPADAN